MKLIMNADDFGYSKGQNYGILECMLNGCVTSTTLLTTMPGTLHAFELIKAHDFLDVGIHLTLDLGTPISDSASIPSLVAADGQFNTYNLSQDTLGVDADEVYQEWKAQIDYAMKHGVTPTHFDSHHHIHMKEDVFDVFVRLAREYDVAIRFHPRLFAEEKRAVFEEKIKFLPHANQFANGFYQDGVNLDFFKNLPIYEDITIEAMCHPAYLDKEIQSKSSYNMGRVEEQALLTSPELEALIEELGIELIEYSSLI